MRRTLALIVLWTAFAIGCRAYAQESILPLPLEQTNVMTALARANRENRVLIVVHQWIPATGEHRPWWMNDSVRAWIKWHAIFVECKPEDETSREYLQLYPRDAASYGCGFDVIIHHARSAGGGPVGEYSGGLTAVAVLLQLQGHYERALETQPVWAAGHEIDCPPPKPPARKYYFRAAEDGLPTTTDAPKPREGERYVDVLARVTEADKLIAAGERQQAFALLTWAWERGPELDPAFAVARTGLVLPRMTALRKADPALGKRMTQIGEAELTLYPWYDDRDELSYLALRYHTGEKDKVVKRAIVENLDIDEQIMAGVIPSRLADLKVSITELATEPVISPSDWKSIMRVVRFGTPSGCPADIKERWRRARVELAAEAAVRTYAALLASENGARAESVAQDVLNEAASASAPIRASVLRALVMAAVSVGKADSGHAAWLDEAARIDPPAKVKGKEIPAGDPLRRAIGVGAK